MSDNGNGYEPDYSVLKRFPISAWEWPRIAVFIPILPALPYADEVVPHFLEIARTGVNFLYHPFGSIDSTRNRVAEALLASDYTHVLMLDGDQKHPPDIVQRMAGWVIHKPERLVVGGLYFNRRPPYLPLAWVKQDDGFFYQVHKWEKGLIEDVDLLAAGCLLINREVFEQIERPWFFNDYTGVEEQKELFNYPTEDIGFCKKVREAGIQICLDTTIESLHGANAWISEQTYRSYYEMKEVEGEIVEVPEAGGLVDA